MQEQKESIPFYKPFCSIVTSAGELPDTEKQTLRIMILSDKKIEFGEIQKSEIPVIENLNNYILPINITSINLEAPDFITYEKELNEVKTSSKKATLSCRVRTIDNETLKALEENPDEPIIIIDGDR